MAAKRKVAKKVIKPLARASTAQESAQVIEPKLVIAKSQERFLGMPGSWKYPGLDSIINNIWNPDADAKAFPPKVWGFGWSLNFGYAFSKNKPLWARSLVFLFGVLVVLVLLYVLIALIMIGWFAFDVYVLGNTGVVVPETKYLIIK